MKIDLSWPDLNRDPLVLETDVILEQLALHPAIVRGPGDGPVTVQALKQALQERPLTVFQTQILRLRRGGDLLIGPYVLLDKIGEGGMGEVYKARHAKLGRLVAIKVIRPDKLKTRTAAKRFLREVRATARLDHPQIVRALDADSCQDRHYLVMELVEGYDLARLVQTRGPLSVPQACKVVFQVALALQSLHENGIVHRDLKPTNLIQDSHTGLVKVLDLGLSRLLEANVDLGEQTEALTLAGSIIGTPDFMSPEQAQNAHVADVRSDLYSLGCVFYFLLTAQVPYVGGTSVSKMTRQMTEEFPDVRQLRPSVPPEVVRVLTKLTLKNPTQRYQTPAELIAEISAVNAMLETVTDAKPVEDLSTQETMVIPQLNLSENNELASMLNLQAPHPTKENRTSFSWFWWLLLGVFTLVLVVIGGTLVLLNSLDATSPEAASPAKPATEAIDEVKPFRDRANRPGEDLTTLREELLASVDQALGTPRAAPLLNLLKRLPSPSTELPRTEDETRPILILGETKRSHRYPYKMLSLAGDGHTLAMVDGFSNKVQIFNREGTRKAEPFEGHEARVEWVTVSRDGTKLLACSRFQSLKGSDSFERQLVVWDTATRKLLLKLNHDNGGWTISGAFSPDGRYVLAGSYAGIKLWDLQTGEMVKEYSRDGMDWSGVVAFSADGTRLFSGGNFRNQFRVWNRETGELLHELDGHDRSAQAIAVHPKLPILVTIAEDAAARIWNHNTGELLHKISFTDGWPVTACWSVDGEQLLISQANSQLKAYAVKTWKQLWEATHTGGCIRTMQACPRTGLLATGSDSGRLQWWNPVTGEEQDPHQLSGAVRHVAFSRDDRDLICFAERGNGIRFNLARQTLSGTPELKSLTIQAIRPDGRQVLGRGEAWRAIQWNDGSPDLADSYDLQGVAELSWSGRHILARPFDDHNQIHFIDLPSRTKLQSFKSVRSSVQRLALSYDGKLAAGHTPDGILVFNTDDGCVLRTVEIRAGELSDLRFSPDNTRLVTAGPKSQVWTIPLVPASRTPLTFPRPSYSEDHPQSVNCVAFSLDSEWQATASSGGEILLRSLSSSGRFRRLQAGWAVHSLAFSYDGRLLAAGLSNGTVALFRISP